MTTIDINRCRRGMAQLDVRGTPRPALIEEAIRLIQESPSDALMKRYLGIKNYAGFGDQREDHDYGYGPKHGTIVFNIGRTDEARRPAKALDSDAIYYLEAYRDFEGVKWPGDGGRDTFLRLSDAIRMFDRLTKQRNTLADAFEVAAIDAHPDTALESATSDPARLTTVAEG